MPRGGKKRRLSFKESKELEALPHDIDAREQERERLYASLADPAFLRDGAAVAEAKAAAGGGDRARLAALTERWEVTRNHSQARRDEREP